MTEPSDAAATFASRAVKVAIRTAWMAVILGLTVQILVLITKVLAGGSVPMLRFAADVAQGISWAVLVCGGVAIGTVVRRSQSALMGLLGLLVGPLAWGLAKGAQKGVQALSGLPQDQFNAFFFLISGIKGVEYGVLGAALGIMAGQPWGKLPAHFAVGLGVGVITALLVVALNVARGEAMGTPMAIPAIAGLAVSETVFPLGCALLLYLVQRLGRGVEAMLRAPAAAPAEA